MKILEYESPSPDEDVGPLNHCVDEVFRLDRFIEITSTGFRIAARAEESFHNYADHRKQVGEPLDTDEYSAQLAEAVLTSKAAKDELDNHLTYLYALGAVKLWSILESTVEDSVYRFLHDEREWTRSEKIKNLKGPLIEFVSAPRPEQATFLIAQLKQTTNADLKKGVGRFETLLAVVGLDGPIDKLVARALLEFTEVRHLLVHRLGTVDKQFVEQCPWVHVSVGQLFSVQLGHYDIYSTAVLWYAREISRRLRAKNGNAPLPDAQSELKAGIDRIRGLWGMRPDVKSAEGEGGAA
jgi:hypothetical protein